jgi:hypothetical protein
MGSLQLGFWAWSVVRNSKRIDAALFGNSERANLNHWTSVSWNSLFLKDATKYMSPSTHPRTETILCKIWGSHGCDYEECCLLGYKTPVRTSQETHYVSTTESSQLMLCKIWGFHGSDYEECRLLEYKTPVRTSQETHYVSTTESSQLMLCKIWGFHGSDYEERRLLEYKTPVRTSQETHYVSATEPRELMLCKIWGFHGSDYEECRLLEYKNPGQTVTVNWGWECLRTECWREYLDQRGM